MKNYAEKNELERVQRPSSLIYRVCNPECRTMNKQFSIFDDFSFLWRAVFLLLGLIRSLVQLLWNVVSDNVGSCEWQFSNYRWEREAERCCKKYHRSRTNSLQFSTFRENFRNQRGLLVCHALNSIVKCDDNESSLECCWINSPSPIESQTGLHRAQINFSTNDLIAAVIIDKCHSSSSIQ